MTMYSIFRSVGRWVLVASLSLGTMGVAWAEPPARAAPVREEAAPAGRVRIEVLTVYANHSGQVDPRLREIQRQLSTQPFTGFQLLSTHDDQLGGGQSASFPVEGGRRMRVTLEGRNEDRAKIRIELYKGDEKKVDTTVWVQRNRYFMFGGFPYQDGKLFVPVTVVY